ncbi:MAG: urease accessory protein UreD, partial [Pseudomonadota bacterium]
EDTLGQVRHLRFADVSLGSSAWDGKCVIRMSAADAFPLKRALAAVVEKLGRAAPPRVWQV